MLMLVVASYPKADATGLYRSFLEMLLGIFGFHKAVN